MNIVKGSLSDVAQKTNQSLPMVLADIDAVVIVDVSYSMTDSCQNSTRYKIANQKLAELQEKFQGKVAVIQFSDRAELVPDGKLQPLFESTNMVKALTVAHDYDDLGLKLIMISDGEPNDPQATLNYAKRFASTDRDWENFYHVCAFKQWL